MFTAKIIQTVQKGKCKHENPIFFTPGSHSPKISLPACPSPNMVTGNNYIPRHFLFYLNKLDHTT